MNNEGKILVVLEQLQQGQTLTNARLDKMDARLDKMDTRLDKMDTRLEKIDTRLDKIDTRLDKVDIRLDSVEQRILKIEVIQENEVAKKIQLLAEGHSGIAEKLRCLDELTDKVDDIQNTVDVLKHIVVKK